MESPVYSDDFRINEGSTHWESDTKRPGFKVNAPILDPIIAPALHFEKKKETRKISAPCDLVDRFAPVMHASLQTQSFWEPYVITLFRSSTLYSIPCN